MSKKPTNGLAPFEGLPVLSTTIAITNAGDGLSQAMKIDPKLMHIGDKVHVVLECEVAKVRHDPLKDTDAALQRVHVLRAGRATMVDQDFVSDVLDEQDRKLEEALGISRLFDEEGNPIEPEQAAD